MAIVLLILSGKASMIPKNIRYGLILTLIIATINFAFISLGIFIGFPMSRAVIVKIIIVVISSILSGTATTYLIISASPVARDFLATFRYLLRLESLSHPLMVKFSQVAPGTYHHTLNVANIASRAAKAIKADSLLTRVAAYYHDLGKINHPQYFTENQHKKNTHDNIDDPATSAKIIINHVKEGIAIAEENHLPQEIIDCIQQHHGTTLVNYFYEIAKNKDNTTKKSLFRYPGPKPLSREAGILMLADSIEATIQSFSKPTNADIKTTIDNVIEARLKDNQLSLSGLTPTQLAKIRRSFLESLTAIFHQRIEYEKTNQL